MTATIALIVSGPAAVASRAAAIECQLKEVGGPLAVANVKSEVELAIDLAAVAIAVIETEAGFAAMTVCEVGVAGQQGALVGGAKCYLPRIWALEWWADFAAMLEKSAH